MIVGIATLCGDSRGRGSRTEDFLRFLACARDSLRRFAWSRFKNWGLFTTSAVRARPSAEIRVVVPKLRTFYDFCWPRATLCGDSCGPGSKTEDFLRFLACARDPLRRFALSRFKNCFCGARATLCGDSRGRGSKTEDFLRFWRSLRRSCASKRSCCGAVRLLS